MGQDDANYDGASAISHGRHFGTKQQSTELMLARAVTHLFAKGLLRLEGDGEARRMPKRQTKELIPWRTRSHLDVAKICGRNCEMGVH